MIKYMKNKGFIPEKFYNKIELNRCKKENQIVMLFLIINLILIPFTAMKIGELKKSLATNRIDISSNGQNKIKSEDINVWIDNMIKDDIVEACITNNNGEITVDNLGKVEELNSTSSIEVRDVKLNSDGKYNIGVSLDE